MAIGQLLPSRALLLVSLLLPGAAVAATPPSPGAAPSAAAPITVVAVDAQDRAVDLARSHASLQRLPPEQAPDPGVPAGGGREDSDALSYVLAGAAPDLPATIDIQSWSAAGELLGELPAAPLRARRCPAAVAAAAGCVSTAPIRVVAEELDARHPLAAERSLLGELGGAVVLRDAQGRELKLVRVAGPRDTPLGPIERYRATLRVLVVRLSPRGAVPVGAGDAGALGAAREAVARAQALWGACGIGFGPPDEISVQIVDPPPPHLLAVGCGHGLPAGGGQLRFRVEGREIQVELPRGMQPQAAARRVAVAVRAAGFDPRVSDNAPIGAAALPTADLSVRLRDGRLARLDLPKSGPLDTDPTLRACIGTVDLDDGLSHFGDVDAVVGTLEERTLLRAYDDGDPGTIDVLIVPGFSGGDRIGESFIGSDGGSIRNTVLVDRAGLRAGRGSFALAHELGHVLLDDPGHPDDYGVDTPTRLMDADADEPTAFGPSRLIVDECVRALRQGGPDAALPLLRPWPLTALTLHPKK